MATVRPLIPPRPLRPEAQELLRQVRRLRMRTRPVAVLGLLLAAAGCAAIVASSGGVPLLAALLPIGLAIALLAERRLARLSAVDRRVHLTRGRDLTLTAALLGWGWAMHGGFDGGGGSGGSGGDCFDGGAGDGGGGC